MLSEVANEAASALRKRIGYHLLVPGPDEVVRVPDYLTEQDYIVVPRAAVIHNPENNYSSFCILMIYLRR